MIKNFSVVVKIAIFLLTLQGMVCLRNVHLVVPESVERGSRVEMRCLYDLEQEVLYTVKWYRGDREFCRYSPRDVPPLKIFRIPGIDVDSLTAHRPAKGPKLPAQHRRDRLEFARNHCEWTLEQWRTVLFSDETRVCLFCNDRRRRVYRRQGERFTQPCFEESVEYGGGSCMFWGGISVDGKTELVCVSRTRGGRGQGSLNAGRYITEILEEHVVPYAGYEVDIPVMHWPARSPDLNPIEHLWDDLKRRVRARDPAPTTLQELQDAVLEEWEQIPQEAVATLREATDAQRLSIQAATRTANGRYTCEVSADAPSFQTAQVHAHMYVVDLPKSGPEMQGLNQYYRAGMKLKVECSSHNSLPAANLSFFINSEPAHKQHVWHRVSPANGSLWNAYSTIQFVVQKHHFIRGKMKIRCTANIYSIYLKSNEQCALEERLPTTPVSLPEINEVILYPIHRMADTADSADKIHGSLFFVLLIDIWYFTHLIDAN
ncbi:uncharacterized protein LOC106711574 [Papilio machaon]|uniref:uncharacterized protein LOC106711574 n=1 Tax=Papilio machaon TaxID=76193 RepID=UPI001E663829|nr:uncharacterized protein LOC106711574 [Papilio machaon]